MNQLYACQTKNDSYFCNIFPGKSFPNGLLLTYDSCPEYYNNQTHKAIRFCCIDIIFKNSENSFYIQAEKWLCYNSSMLLVLPAVFFNILALIVLKQFKKSKSNLKTSTTFYMRCLCVFDALTIISKFLNEIIVVRNGIRANPIALTSFVCKILSFLESMCAISSIYLLIAMSIDKLVCVLIPLKVGQLLTPTKAKIYFSVILVLVAIFSSYDLFDKRVYVWQKNIEPEIKDKSIDLSSLKNVTTRIMKITNSSSTKTSVRTNESHKLRLEYDCDSNWPEKRKDWILINNIVRVFFPIFMLCFCNTSIAIALTKAQKRANAMFNESEKGDDESKRTNHLMLRKFGKKKLDKPNMSSSSDSEDEFKSNNEINQKSVKFQPEQIKRDKHRKETLASESKKSKQKSSALFMRNRNNTQHISLMLLAVSIGFIVLNLPFAIRTLFHRQFEEHFMIDIYHENNSLSTEFSKTQLENSIKFEFFSILTYFLLDLNYIANFFLYFFSGNKFRTQLFELFKPKDKYASNMYASYRSSVTGVPSSKDSSLYRRIRNRIDSLYTKRNNLNRRRSTGLSTEFGPNTQTTSVNLTKNKILNESPL